MAVREACPACQSQQFKKNGHIHNGKQNHQCKDCGRQFVLQPENCVIDEGQRSVVERLLLEKISLHGICRAVGVSMRWLMDFIVARFEAAPKDLKVQLPSRPGDVLLRCVEAEADEMHSFVQNKANEQWLWLAMDKPTRQIVAVSRWRSQSQECAAAVGQPAGSMWCTKGSFQRIATKRSRRKRGEPITSSAATIRYASASPDWCVRRWRSPRNWRIISVRFGTSSAITT